MAAKKTHTKHIPQRTCVACRQQQDKRRLTRIVRTPDAGVAVDLTGKQAGRGAYLCEQDACWARALQTPLLDRALKTKVSAAEKALLAEHRPKDRTAETE